MESLERYIEAKTVPEFLEQIHNLPERYREEVAIKYLDMHIELQHRVEEMKQKSAIANRDIYALLEMLSRIEAEKKAYTGKIEVETGTGNVSVTVKGGDTKFIIPIVLVLGIILIAILLLILK